MLESAAGGSSYAGELAHEPARSPPSEGNGRRQAEPSTLGINGLLDFKMEVTLDGETLSAAAVGRLLAHSDGLALIRGKWVEVDHARLSQTLEQFEAVERRASTDGLTFGEAMRMLEGAGFSAVNRPHRWMSPGAKRLPGLGSPRR